MEVKDKAWVTGGLHGQRLIQFLQHEATKNTTTVEPC